jgi:hypothetical protein
LNTGILGSIARTLLIFRLLIHWIRENLINSSVEELLLNVAATVLTANVRLLLAIFN